MRHTASMSEVTEETESFRIDEISQLGVLSKKYRDVNKLIAATKTKWNYFPCEYLVINSEKHYLHIMHSPGGEGITLCFNSPLSAHFKYVFHSIWFIACVPYEWVCR